MIRVKDENGGIQKDMYSKGKGTFVFCNDEEYRLYQKRKEFQLSQKLEVDSLKSKISKLEKIIETLSEKING